MPDDWRTAPNTHTAANEETAWRREHDPGSWPVNEYGIPLDPEEL